MRKARSGGIAVAALLAAVGIALLAAAPASAEVNGGCSASMNGVNLAHTPPNGGPAVTVGKDDVVPFTMSGVGGQKFTELHIYLTFAGVDADIYDAPAGGGTWSHNVDVHSFARFGVGYYRLKGVGDLAGGGSCDGEALIKVTGDPLGTVAGDAGVGATVAGVLGMLGAGLGAGGGGGASGPGGSVTQDDVKKEEDIKIEQERVDEYGNPLDQADAVLEQKRGWCLLLALAALVALPLLLLFGSSAALMAVVAPAVKVRRRTWPFVLGAFGGLLTGLGAGVLLQEYAIVYPTRTYGIIYIVGGILFGLAVPLLRRSLSR
jgi:hypothetical protein